MNTILVALFTIIIVASLIAALYIILYNKLQFSKIRIDEAEKVILEEIKNRYDLVMQCKNIIKKTTKKEIDILKDIETSYKTNISSYLIEKKINDGIKTIYVINNDYPKLETKKEYKEIMRKIEESNEKIEAAKSFYNKNNATLIALVKSFPSNIIALIHKIDIKPFYDGKEIFNEIDDGIKI